MQRIDYNGPCALIVRIVVVCALAVWTTSSGAAEPDKGEARATATGRPSAAPAYPLKVSANGRYLVDQNDAPFLLTGDSTQALTTNISTADAEMFFADRQAHGFNADWVNLLTAGPDMAGRNDGSTYDGIRPFTGYVPGGTDWNHNWSLLSGATGQLYGNGYTWPFKSGWKSHLDTPGAEQMVYLKSFFESRPWYKLVPDQTHRTLTAGYGTMITDKNYVGGVDSNDYATAARIADGSLVLAYIPTRRTVTIDMTRLSDPARARWFDPSNGAYTVIDGSPLATTGSRTFTPPGNNHDGDGDWVLVLEAAAAAPAFSTQSYAKYGQLLVAKMESAPFPHPKRADGYKYNGKLFTAQESYSDNSVAVFIPKGFRATKRIDFVVHFHGWTGRLENVLPHYQLIEQFAASGRNAVLVVPQGPRGATDSFGGKLEDADGFKRFMDEVLLTLKKSAAITPDASVGRLILSGHSGGGRVVAKILAVGGMTRNVNEVWLFDAMYSDAKGYMAWQEEQRGRLLNIYTDHGGTKTNCEQLMADLRRRRIVFSAMEDSMASPADMSPRLPIFLHTALAHDDVLQARRTFRLFLETSILETIAAPQEPTHLREEP